MATAVQCEHCGQGYSVREDLLGKRMKCKACGQATALVAAAPRPKAAGSAPASESPASSSKRPARRKDAAEPKSRESRTPARQTEKPLKAASANKSTAPPPNKPSGVAASVGTEKVAAAAPNLLDLLDDTALSAAASAPLSSGVVLKAGAPAPLEKPKAKKKKKKKQGSGEMSDNAQVLMRMAGGAFLVLLGLLAIGRAIYAIASKDDENGAIGFLVGRWVVGGVSSISGGIKLICG